jgi:hypothetical protein
VRLAETRNGLSGQILDHPRWRPALLRQLRPNAPRLDALSLQKPPQFPRGDAGEAPGRHCTGTSLLHQSLEMSWAANADVNPPQARAGTLPWKPWKSVTRPSGSISGLERWAKRAIAAVGPSHWGWEVSGDAISFTLFIGISRSSLNAKPRNLIAAPKSQAMW